MQKPKSCWFHDWELDCDKIIIKPERGPFDPRTDAQRSIRKQQWVCCQCGAKQLRSA